MHYALWIKHFLLYVTIYKHDNRDKKFSGYNFQQQEICTVTYMVSSKECAVMATLLQYTQG